MRRIIQKYLAVLGLVGATASSGMAEAHVDMIVMHTDEAVELYVSMPTDLAVAHFGIAADDLTDARGFADFKGFYEGTFEQGDKLWSVVDTKINGTPIAFEAMSMMVHPTESALPFRTPIEAMISIQVCGVEATDVTLSDTQTYLGLIAFTEQAGDTMTFDTLPLPAGTRVNVQTFQDHQFVSRESVLTEPGTKLQITAQSQSIANKFPAGTVTAIMIFCCVAGIGYLGLQGQKRSA